MIWSLAYGGSALDDATYVNAAERAAEFILSKVRTDGRLQRYYRSGRAVEPAFLDDYASLVLGLIELYEATFDAKWLAEAKNLSTDMIELFHDRENGGFFLTGSDQPDLIARRKPAYDGAVPSGNSIAALALLRLGHITREDRFKTLAEQSLSHYSAQMEASPISLTAMLVAADLHIGPTREIIIAGKRAEDDTKEMLRTVRTRFLPRTVVALRESGKNAAVIEELISGIEHNVHTNERATAYVCEDFVCRAPVNNLEDLEKSLSDRGY
jgi:uncharacterized protein YyaL (SSP411 family)